MRKPVLVGALLVLAMLGLWSGAHAQGAKCIDAKLSKYKVKIDSAPQGAAIYINDKSCPAVGSTPWDGMLPNGVFTVIVEAPGYDPASKAFTVAKLRKTQELFVPLVKTPTIDVRSDADAHVGGATVSIDGQPQGPAPLTIKTTVGRHLIEIKKDGFEPYSQWVEVTLAGSASIAPSLKEIAKPKYGTVVVDADVPDAEVYIDGNKHPDNTPAVISNVIEGVHVIEVRKPPGLPWKQTVNVIADQQTKVRADLAATMNGGVGVVRVLSDAQGARAFIDGTDMGPVPVDIKDVKAGDHIIQVKAPGFQAAEKNVTVAAGGSQIVKFDLNTDISPDQGILKIISSQPDADVFIDGAAVGKAPQEKRVAQGDHPVVVRVAGLKDFTQTVHIDAGKTVTVQADLKAVGKLRVLSTPNATVLINGMPAGKTPFEGDVEIGETVVRLEAPGYVPFEQTVTVAGGATETISRELALAGMSEEQLLAQQRGLSSFGARPLPRGRSTVDFDVGYPYFFNGRVSVGAGAIAPNGTFAFDANVGIRTMFARNEIGLGGRVQVARADPFSAAVFTNLWWGSKLLDDSQRNGLTWDLGAIASLTAFQHVTISGRAYLEAWSDRECPSLNANNPNGFDGTDPIAICKEYKQHLDGGPLTPDDARAEKLTGNSGKDFFDRDAGARFMLSVIAEVALRRDWNVYGILEGAPFQNERALFTNMFNHSMFDTDYNLYLRFGISYKF
ncbi:MAG TPA: PEGA domain-containing protein [Kofleriaceae bacterium]|jgi:hypothetical protein